MDCRIVFYSARKTAFCEKALKKSFSELKLALADTCFATDSKSLGALLIDSFDKCNLVFVIGGLGFTDSRSVQKIISCATSDIEIDECKKLKNEKGDDGYILRADNQLLVMLPDEPEQIEEIMQGPISMYIKVKNNAKA